MLLRHEVDIYPLQSEMAVDGKTFKPGSAFVIPTAQKQFKIIKTVFEKTFNYKDSLFYDVTAWTMPLAFGLPYAEVKSVISLNSPKLNTVESLKSNLYGASKAYAYAIKWNEYYSPKVLYKLQEKGIKAKVATKVFKMVLNNKEEVFDYGTIVIPVSTQEISVSELENSIKHAIAETGVDAYTLPSGFSAEGIDLGAIVLFL